jgi:hypothetical protein
VDEGPIYGCCPISMTPANMGNVIRSSAMDPRFRGDDDSHRHGPPLSRLCCINGGNRGCSRIRWMRLIDV